MSVTTQATEIRPFQIGVPEEQLDDLRRRIEATRWPTKELVDDRSQGVQLATMKAVARYWTTEYDWRRCEARLNALPQFTTEIDGTEIHFIHVRSPHEDAMPLIMTHGWPGSVVELLETVGPLTDPTAHGGDAEDAFHLVLPSMPGYGFSPEPKELGWNAVRIATAWAELMKRLGYDRYVAQGGDVGAAVTDLMGRLGLEGLVSIHTNLLVAAIAIGDQLPAETEQERAAHAARKEFAESGFGYFLEMATRPQTIGYAMLDSPIAMAAWMLDHDTDSYYKIAGAFVDDRPTGNLTRDHILDNVTLWNLLLFDTTSSARDGGVDRHRPAADGFGDCDVRRHVPVDLPHPAAPAGCWRSRAARAAAWNRARSARRSVAPPARRDDTSAPAALPRLLGRAAGRPSTPGGREAPQRLLGRGGGVPRSRTDG